MTNSSCAVECCSYNRRNVRKQKLDIVFHTFPRVPILRQKWIKFCSRGADWVPGSNETICSVHFKEDDYQMAMSPLMRSARGFRRLNLSAVPTIVKGIGVPIAKRREMDEIVRQKLLDELYGKDAIVRDNDHSYDDIYNLDMIKQKQPNPLEKLVFNLENFPNVCMLCLKEDINEEHLFSPFNLYHNDLERTFEQMYEEVTGDSTDDEDRTAIIHLLPDKVCEECMEALITFYQYQRQLKCLKRFTTGMAHLLQGNKNPMREVFEEQETYLVNLLQSLNICAGTEDKMTFERLDKEVATYKHVTKRTLFEQANHEEELIMPQIPMVINEEAYDYEELIEEESIVDVESTSTPAASPIEPYKHIPPKIRGRPRKQVFESNATFMCPYPGICAQRFTNDDSLQRHVREDHKYFKCRTCDAKIKFYDLYKKHIESHAIARTLLLCHNQKTSSKETKCSICQKAFQSEELLRRHEKTHSGERNFVCGTCLGVFLTNEDYRNHRCMAATFKQQEFQYLFPRKLNKS